MNAKIIDGKALAQSVRAGLKEKVEQFKLSSRAPGLTVILVGDNPASQVYVRNKIKACTDVGITSKLEKLPAETSEAELLALLEKLNADDSVDGILVQLPLPRHINEQKVIETIRADKDVDGFHVVNVGSVVTGIGGFRSCTPYGVIKMLESVDYPLTGAHALVIGRSNIVGKPMAMLMLRENATVTVCHSHTKDLKEVTKRADILIVAIGKPKMITADYVKEGAVVIDVGIHRPEGGKLCGDVDFDSVEKTASAITPVPGGVGPMTIAMLMNNCVEAKGIQKA
ncbi:MAG TPA: bifunctional methylenetetrahydrofolate dehydrogenase/methenyltetrahydrofolate cyclohydrolase FolD [Sutterellaceae bacterium]|nr:bifunctional methylenetetrahydrofolate dehydrogenase/methenyltetrahydrofolate cyclohydrolase FolD [Sutterellaceae bacterium]